MRQRHESRVELRLQLLQKILRFTGREPYQELLLDAVRTYYRLSGRERKMEAQLLRSGRYGEVEAMGQTWLGRVKSKAEREGRAEGELLALQRAVQQAIRTRFPNVPSGTLDLVAGVHDARALED